MSGIGTIAAAWCEASLLAAIPWTMVWRPWLTPAVLVLALAAHRWMVRSNAAEPWASLVVVLSSMAHLVMFGGLPATGGWLLLAAFVAVLAWCGPLRGGWRGEAATLAASVGWATAFAVRPELLEPTGGGWLAPALLLFTARRPSWRIKLRSTPRAGEPAPPSRAVRGTLSLRGVVVGDENQIPLSIPTDLELRAGEALAVVCDEPTWAFAFAAVLAARRAPREGEVTVDGVPVEVGERLANLVARGEWFVAGTLDENLACLSIETPQRSTLSAAHEACSLNDVVDRLDGGEIDVDGAPLTPGQRFRVLLARVIPSDYRLLIVVDPLSWVDEQEAELWRGAVVRASVGRTAVWLTSDRRLAERAGQMLVFRDGAVRPCRVGE